MNTMDTARQCAASREAGPGSKRIVLASPNADRILSDQLVGGGKNVLQQIGSKTCHRSPCVWPNSSRAWRSTAIGPGEGTLVRYAASGRVIDRGVHHPLFVSAGHAGRDQFFSASGQPNSPLSGEERVPRPVRSMPTTECADDREVILCALSSSGCD